MHVTRLLTAAVKGLAVAEPGAVRLEASGAVDDRAFFAVDDSGTLVSITRTGGLCGTTAAYDADRQHLVVQAPDGRRAEGPVQVGEDVPVEHFGLHMPGRRVPGPWDALLSELAGERLRLLRATGPSAGSDVHPVTLLADASVQAVAQAAGVAELDPRRFRMLVGLDGCAAFEEDTWAGRQLRLGGAVVQVGGPVPRCVATQRDPDTGSNDLAVLAALTALRGVQPSELGERGVNLGVYGRVLVAGVVRVGDAVELV